MIYIEPKASKIFGVLKIIPVLLVVVFFAFNVSAQNKNQKVQSINLIFSSDVHYGISRKSFRGDTGVASYRVNAAMIKQMNAMAGMILPEDGGVDQGKPIKYVDYLVLTGDITNRMEPPVQTAAKSWGQFTAGYQKGITLINHEGTATALCIVPGNHDISNAIGFPKQMVPATDPSAMVNIYNLMMNPKKPITRQTFNYVKDKVNYSFNRQGIHFMFITLWPDSAERIWMEKDLTMVGKNIPVLIFTHDPPTCDVKHFTNPVAPFKIVSDSKFENLVGEHYKEGITVAEDEKNTDMEQRGWVKFLKKHPNIKAYFHGHSNYNEFYIYHGPDNDVNLNVFRVDSPMKGKYSAKDETKLSFQFVSVDPEKRTLTVRECLWNTEPLNTKQKSTFGKSITVSLN